MPAGAAVTVKLGNKVLRNGTDYTAAYTNNINAGSANVVITGKGSYQGVKTASFTIGKTCARGSFRSDPEMYLIFPKKAAAAGLDKRRSVYEI